MLPNTVIIGAAKCGTTTLADLLSRHPEVFVCDPKEPGFFVEELNFGRGLEWYARLFATAGSARVRVDASTAYTKMPTFGGVPARIGEHLGRSTRFIYMVRHPVDRIRSMYVHNVHRAGERRPIDIVVREEPSYIDHSSYYFQISQYLERFDSSQIHVVITEDLGHAEAATLAGLAEFLGLSSAIAGADRRLNTSQQLRRRGRPRPALRFIDSTPLRHAKRALPGSLKSRLRPHVRTPLVPSEHYLLSAPVEAMVVDRLRDDLELFYRDIEARARPLWSVG